MSDLQTLPAQVVRWIRSHSAKNYWRVTGWYELDDLIQDGLLKAYQCLEKYGAPGGPDCPSCGSANIRLRVVRRKSSETVVQVCRECGARFIDPPHFMALVQQSFHRQIAELLRRKRGVDDVTVKTATIGEDESEVLSRLGSLEQPLQELAVLVAEMPDRLRRVVEFYLGDDPTRLWRNLRVRLDGEDETLDSRLRRLTGFPEGANFEAELRTYLWERNADLIGQTKQRLLPRKFAAGFSRLVFETSVDGAEPEAAFQAGQRLVPRRLADRFYRLTV